MHTRCYVFIIYLLELIEKKKKKKVLNSERITPAFQHTEL